MRCRSQWRHCERRLRSVTSADHGLVLRLLAKRNKDLGSHRTQLVCRLHAMLCELVPGGIAKEINGSNVEELLAKFKPGSEAEQLRLELALEVRRDVFIVDEQLKASHRRIRDAVRASGTSLTDLFGVGPILACMIIGYTGDVHRFRSRDHYAAYNGTAPVEIASGGRSVHRLSQRGNRQLNHAIHMVAVCQIRQRESQGRAYFERKVEEGKTKREALRALKRHVSNAVYRQLLVDAGRN